MNLCIVLAALALGPGLHAAAAAVPSHAGGLAELLVRMQAISDPLERGKAVDAFLRDVRLHGAPIMDDSVASFVYSGPGARVRIASDLNAWKPDADTLAHLPGTDLFYVSLRADPAARFEYKFVVDSAWILDPLNPRRAMGGYGPNSEVCMPLYRPPEEIAVRPLVPHGTLDTLLFRSRILRRTMPITVYRPPGDAAAHPPSPVLYVLDGGEYLSLAQMNVVLDNLIDDGAITPPVCVFLDPRTNPADPQTSMRMTDYMMSDSFVAVLVGEIRPFLQGKYRMTGSAASTGIMGASLGGLAAIHAAFARPDVFGLCAAQSPSLWLQDARMLTRLQREPVMPIRFHIDTGTMRDAQEESRRARDILAGRGYALQYEEHPEGHNWFNWRARLGTILRYFWGRSLPDSLAIVVRGASREFAYTNKGDAFLYGETNDAFRPGWQGFSVFGHRFLDDYLLSADGRMLDRSTAVTTVYPDYLRRAYPGGIIEELHPVDSLPCFAVTVTAPRPTVFSVAPLRSDGRAGGDFVVQRSPAMLSVARRTHLARSAQENYPVWLSVHADGGTPVDSTYSRGARFGPGALVSPRVRTLTVCFAVGDERSQTDTLARVTARRLPALIAERRSRMSRLLASGGVQTGDPRFDRALAWARLSLDALVMHQVTPGIFAGLPWFNNYWGRDTFISLPGALLVTGQFRNAKEILRSFAEYQQRDSLSPDYGRIPNLVTTTDRAYNTADGTPRFVMMVREYLERSGDNRFLLEIYPTVLRAIEGTIRMHTDSLGFLTHGDAETWMDAVGPDGPWSPRGNRANDVQALWAGQLEAGIAMATSLGDVASARDWTTRLVLLRRSFTRMFVTPAGIADRLRPDGRPDMRVRPNQIFTGILLTGSLRMDVARAVTSRLAYPYGVASLSQDDPDFHPFHQEPSHYPKDAAYHNGTVWTWLQGPLISELCRGNRQDLAYTITANSVHQILDRGAVGTQSELLDAIAHPGEREPGISGTFSQAWSIAEFVRNFYDDYLGVRYDRSARTLHCTPRLPSGLRHATARINLDGEGFVVTVAGSGPRQEVTISTKGFADTMSAVISFRASDDTIRTARLPVSPGSVTRIVLQNGAIVAWRGGMSFPLRAEQTSIPPRGRLPADLSLARPVLRPGLRALRGPGYPLLRGGEALRTNPGAAALVDAEDPAFDDTVRYAYPNNANVVPGSFDIRRLTVAFDSLYAYFTLRFRALSDPGWHPAYGSQLTFAAIAIDTDGAPGTGSLRVGKNASCVMPGGTGYERIIYCGGGYQVEDAAGTILAAYVPSEADRFRPMGDAAAGTIRFSVPRPLLGSPSPGWTMTVFAGGQDDHGGSGLGEFRTVLPARGEWNGGGKPDSAAANVYDTLTARPRR